ncbi:hypothetical protein P43SY_011825 [Pythium insidiosum]|uniref:Amino acid transporter transmembrane domain-containing protein n=1 Tax=Pythium insidiosum TaxID=114742 RepID=A0AAD5L5W3_PYTIN|nr:hypothetical protein P43SY_011825 [Pythium insidiosum]
MAGGGPSIGSYSPLTGFVFIFNLIVGAGALTIPHAFAQVGLLYGALALALLALTSYVTATFMIEAIAGVNALRKRPRELEGGVVDAAPKGAALEASDGDDAPTTEFMPLMVPHQVPAGCARDYWSEIALTTSSCVPQDNDRLEKKLRGAETRMDFDLSRKVELAQMAHALFNHHGIVAFYTCVLLRCSKERNPAAV